MGEQLPLFLGCQRQKMQRRNQREADLLPAAHRRYAEGNIVGGSRQQKVTPGGYLEIDCPALRLCAQFSVTKHHGMTATTIKQTDQPLFLTDATEALSSDNPDLDLSGRHVVVPLSFFVKRPLLLQLQEQLNSLYLPLDVD